MSVERQKMVIITNKPNFQVSSDHIIYADLSPDVSRILLGINADAIFISISNLLSTQKGERLNFPQYGADLPDFLFELMNEDTAWEIKVRIFQEISTWEPRVELNMANSYVIPDYENHSYDVQLYFTLKGLDNVAFQYSGTITRTKEIFGSLYKR